MDTTTSIHMVSQYSVKFFILLGLWALAFYPVYPELFFTWLNDSNNSHGILVPIVSLYFIWHNREKLHRARIDSCKWGAVILLLSSLLYLLSLAGHVAFSARLMLVFSLIGLVMFNLGLEKFKVIAFPLVFLFFMIPIPISITSMVALPLQLFATNISAVIIRFFSIPVFQEGNMLYFAQTQLEVAEACSGIRSIVSLIMLSTIFVYISKKGWGNKIVLLTSAIPLAILANIIRVSGTGILAHFYGAQVAQGFLHEFSGLAVFAFGFLVLCLEFFWLEKTSKKRRLYRSSTHH